MKPYLAQIAINLKLTLRDKEVVFFNYAFPLPFFFILAQFMHAEQGGVIVQVVTMVIVIGVLGNGFFGAGMRAVMEREANILRRFKVAPISAGPILVSSLVTGLINYLPSVILMLLLSHFIYGMPWPQRWLSLLIYVSLGLLAFRSLGLMIASVVNSMQENQIVIQLLYLPMLFLSGTTIPMTALPSWVQIVAQFLPATHLVTGLQSILGGHETLFQNWNGALALMLTVVLGTFLGMKLFRWEKDDKISGRAKLWLVGVFVPFLVLGMYQAHSRDSIAKAKVLDRGMRRSRSLLIRGARIFVGDGSVIESGGVLIRNGKIAEIYTGAVPDAKQLKAESMEASGKTLLPGLIDVHVHLAAPGGFYESQKDYNLDVAIPRELAAYLYCGVTALKSNGDPLDTVLKVRERVNSGERLGAELFLSGPMFTAVGGHGTEYTKDLSQNIRAAAEAQLVRLPKSPEEARAMVDVLATRGVNGIKAILEAGEAGMLFRRMDVAILKAIVQEAHAKKLPVVVHTGDSKDVADALDAGADGVEHGSFRDAISDALFARMKAQGVSYDPTLSVAEASRDLRSGSFALLERPLVLQVGPAALLQSTKKIGAGFKNKGPGIDLDMGQRNLLKAYQAGVTLVTGSDAGNPLVIHGPTVQREMQLWVEAGIPPMVALRAATWNAAALLGATDRMGAIAKGREANLLLVDGDPTKDIKLAESIQEIIFRGEQVGRTGLFDQE